MDIDYLMAGELQYFPSMTEPFPEFKLVPSDAMPPREPSHHRPAVELYDGTFQTCYVAMVNWFHRFGKELCNVQDEPAGKFTSQFEVNDWQANTEASGSRGFDLEVTVESLVKAYHRSLMRDGRMPRRFEVVEENVASFKLIAHDRKELVQHKCYSKVGVWRKCSNKTMNDALRYWHNSECKDHDGETYKLDMEHDLSNEANVKCIARKDYRLDSQRSGYPVHNTMHDMSIDGESVMPWLYKKNGLAAKYDLSIFRR